MAGQFGYRIPAPSGGATIVLESLGGGSRTGGAAGTFYENTVVTVGTMDKWILCSTITKSVNASVSRISAFDYISSAATHNMTLFNEVSLASPSSGTALCVQHWGVRVNDGINFGTFRRYIDAGGSDSQHHYYNRMRIQGAALNITMTNVAQQTVDTATSMTSGSFNSDGLTEQYLMTFIRDNAIGATTQTGQTHQHFNPTLGGVSYIGETSHRDPVTGGSLNVSWASARCAALLASKIKSL